MEDVFGSLRCPNCRHGLFTAAFCNLGFFKKSHCPYCGTTLRWALRPFAYLLFGIVMAAGCAYGAIHGPALPPQLSKAPTLLTGVGVGICLISVLSMRFQRVEEKRKAKSYHPTRTRLFYPHSS